MSWKRLMLLTCGMLSLAACQAPVAGLETFSAQPAVLDYRTPPLADLQTLPPPAMPLTVAVYQFIDKTGQNKPNELFSEYSRAVTQGGATILTNALEKTGDRKWFTVVERESLPQLLQERQIIRQTREIYGDGPNLPPLAFAGIMMDGGIIGYDSNTLTGGFGARFLGIGGDTQYRRDTVTVYLRAVSVQTGEVLKSVSASKTIYSMALNGGAFKFIDFKDLLEIETGFTTNEPVLLAVRQAIEKSIHALLIEGLIDGYWTLQDQSLAQPLIDRYWQERDGMYGVQRIRTTTTDLHNVGTPVQIEQAPDRNPVHRVPTPAPELPPAEAPVQSQPETGPTYIIPGQQNGRSPIPGNTQGLPPLNTQTPVPR
ncbi:MAG TPA: CsgG/HfaB family protein [Skermanella sp.]|jgi:curli production assembly/transport component CsgG|nr:CsgG/HfaB family protein [Skermanella sp.]